MLRILSLIIPALTLNVALADQHQSEHGDQISEDISTLHGFEQLDTDGDGYISQSEAQAAEAMDLVNFGTTDADGDDRISPQEYQAMMKRQIQLD